MRILLVVPMVPREEGPAIPQLLHAQVEALSGRHEVTLVTAVGDEPGEGAAAAAFEHRTDLEVRLADRRRPPPGRGRWGRRARLAAGWLRGSAWRTVWFAAPGIQREIDAAAVQPFDVVVAEDSSMAGFRYPPGVPRVLTEHEVRRPRPVRLSGTEGSLPGHLFAEVEWRRLTRAQPRAWGRFGLLQVFSARDARSVEQLAPEVGPRVRVNPFGLVVPPAAEPARERDGLMLFVGDFTHAPNRDTARWLAEEILPRVEAEAPGARLRLVGKSMPRETRALAGPAVELVPDAPSVRAHLEEAAVVCAPVRIGGGMRMKVLGAMAAGKAVVTTPRGAEGMNALDPDPPLAVAEGREAVAAATASLLRDGAVRHQLGREARAFAERHHSPEAWGHRLTAVYEEAQATRGSQAGR